jgi:hypothetical protein
LILSDVDYCKRVNIEYESIKKNLFSKTHQEQVQKSEEELKKQQEELIRIQKDKQEKEKLDNIIAENPPSMILNYNENSKAICPTIVVATNENEQLKRKLIKDQLAEFINHIDKKTLDKCNSLTFIPNLDVVGAEKKMSHSSKLLEGRRNYSRRKPVNSVTSPQHSVNVNNIFITENSYLSKENVSKAMFDNTAHISSIINTITNETNFSNMNSSDKSLLDSFVILSDDETIEETIDFNNIPKRVSISKESKGILFRAMIKSNEEFSKPFLNNEVLHVLFMFEFLTDMVKNQFIYNYLFQS